MTKKTAIYRFSFKKTVTAAVMMAVLLSLGTWQVKRLEWKQNLLAEMDQRMAAEPVPLPAEIHDIAALEYSPVTIKGHFIKGHEFLLKPRVENGKTGYHLVMPFKPLEGPVVFVDRGWVDDESLKVFPREYGRMTVSGIVALPHRNYFTPDNNPAGNDWYWADVRAFGQAAGLAAVSPVLVSTVTVKPDIPNNHRQYAIFWFSMAAILFIIYILSCRERLEEKV